MNNNINKADYIAIMDHLRSVRNIKEDREKILDSMTDKYYKTGETFKDRLQFREDHKAEVEPLEKEQAEILEDIEIIDISIKLCKEMYSKAVVNEIIAAFKNHKKNLIDTPLHYKKFEKAFKEVIQNEKCYISNNGYTIYIVFPYYNDITGKQEIYFCNPDNNMVTESEAKKLKYFDLIEPNNILEIVKERQAAKKKLEKMVEEFKANYNKIKEPFNNSNVLNIETKNIYI